ncbi:hypothetical protein ACRAWF_26070 [Streptomyces sp. L7]
MARRAAPNTPGAAWKLIKFLYHRHRRADHPGRRHRQRPHHQGRARPRPRWGSPRTRTSRPFLQVFKNPPHHHHSGQAVTAGRLPHRLRSLRGEVAERLRSRPEGRSRRRRQAEQRRAHAGAVTVMATQLHLAPTPLRARLRRNRLRVLLFLAPGLIGFAVFLISPLVMTVWLCLHQLQHDLPGPLRRPAQLPLSAGRRPADLARDPQHRLAGGRHGAGAGALRPRRGHGHRPPQGRGERLPHPVLIRPRWPRRSLATVAFVCPHVQPQLRPGEPDPGPARHPRTAVVQLAGLVQTGLSRCSPCGQRHHDGDLPGGPAGGARRTVRGRRTSTAPAPGTASATSPCPRSHRSCCSTDRSPG